eukprot:COSAG06_NODE_62211_length_265_cov_1.253012_1_plen_23_part_01
MPRASFIARASSRRERNARARAV